MDLHLGIDVRGREDEKLGDLRQIVLDPETREVVSLVVQHAGFDERELIVPIGAVDAADHSGISLELSSDQFNQLEIFADTRNIAPPPVADNLEEDTNIPPEIVPDVPSIGAATGVESIAFTPVIEEDEHIPARDETIDGECTIWATDGEIGRVSDVRVDDQTNRIVSFAIEKGFIFKHEIEIPVDWVEDIRPGSIILKVEKATISEHANG